MSQSLQHVVLDINYIHFERFVHNNPHIEYLFKRVKGEIKK